MEATIELEANQNQGNDSSEKSSEKATLVKKERELIESTVSLLYMEKIECAPFLLSMLCGAVQFSTYIVLLLNVEELTTEKSTTVPLWSQAFTHP